MIVFVILIGLVLCFSVLFGVRIEVVVLVWLKNGLLIKVNVFGIDVKYIGLNLKFCVNVLVLLSVFLVIVVIYV